MTKITLEIFDDVITTLNKIRDINDNGIEVEIPEGSILFENVLNLKLIKHYADKYGLVVHFATDSEHGNTLIDMIEEGVERTTTVEETIQNLDEQPQEHTGNSNRGTTGILTFLTNIKNPFKSIRFGFKKMTLGAALLPPIIISFLLVTLYHFEQNSREARVKLIINSQPLTKSITVKVKANTPTNVEQKILAGTNVQDTVELTYETETTGEKVVGEKAKGKIKIFNKTDEDKEFKKGQKVNYDDEGVDYIFELDKNVVVEAATEDNTDPLNPVVVYGEAEVEVIATNVGSSYNIDKNRAIEIDDYKKADFSAVSVNDFSGGKSETKKVVAQADIDKIKIQLDKQTTDKADETFKNKVANPQEIIKGSSKNTIVKETPNHEIDDEAEKVSVTRVVSVEGLVYLKAELDRLLDAITKEYVPENFVLSSKDREVSVEILGSSTNSVLNSTEADIQVTLKAYIVPDISEDGIKEQIAGRTAEEAQEILGKVRNIKTFEFDLKRGIIPIFKTVPKDQKQITVEIVKE